MRTAIRKHLRDVVAILFLVLVAAGTAGYILSNQRFYLPAWVPGIGTDFYTVKAEFETGQAVVPGQGQTVNIAGVKIGDLGTVELDDGVATVELKIQEKYKPIYRDATMLLRPKTGLKDMFVELDPGTQAAGELPEGGRIPVAQTRPDVNPDEILAQLDGDTRAYLQILANAGGQAFERDGGDPKQSAAASLRETFKRFEPLNRNAAKFTGLLSQRRDNLERVIHNFGLLAEEIGKKDDQLASLVDSSNANFQVFAEQEANIREALRLLPSTLATTERTLAKAKGLADELGPSFESLRPFARNLGPALRDTAPALEATAPIIRDKIRPFARDARAPVRELRRAAEELAPTTRSLNTVFDVVNNLLDTLAYNPPGQEEGFLFWTAWANHIAPFVFNTQDAHGPIRRGMFLVDCGSLGAVEALVKTLPQLQVLFDLLNAPSSDEICVQQPAATRKLRKNDHPELRAPDTADRGTVEAPEDDEVTEQEEATEAEQSLESDAGGEG